MTAERVGRVRVCLTNTEVPIARIREVVLPATTVFKDQGALVGAPADHKAWSAEGDSQGASWILVDPVTLTDKKRCAEAPAKMLVASPKEATRGSMADKRLFVIAGVLDYPTDSKRPNIEIGVLVDDESVQAIIVSDIMAAEHRPPRQLGEQEAAAECLRGARKLAAFLKGGLGRQTRSMVVIGNVAASTMSYNCTSGPHQTPSLFIAWDKQGRPPKASVDLIEAAGSFLTGSAAGEMRRETEACVNAALKPPGIEFSDRQFNGVKIECQAFTRDGGGGAITIYRRFGRGPVRPEPTAVQLADLAIASRGVTAIEQKAVADTKAFMTWWNDPSVPESRKDLVMQLATLIDLVERCPSPKVNPLAVDALVSGAGLAVADFQPGGRYHPMVDIAAIVMIRKPEPEARRAACAAVTKMNQR